ncbi:MAG: hypothetical protein ONB23_10730 [candidate division KSB1 bacterium]|nr:hypothetical protein [candidate division KSB1 bacterium]
MFRSKRVVGAGWSLSLAVAVGLTLWPQLVVPSVRQVAVVLYPDGVSLVQERWPAEVNRGLNLIEIPDLPSTIIESSPHVRVAAEGGKVRILELELLRTVRSREELLSGLVGKTVDLVTDRGSVSGTLQAVVGSDFLLERGGGGLVLVAGQTVREAVLPSGTTVRARPILRLTVESDSQGEVDLDLTYQTTGLGWQARYSAVLEESGTQLQLGAWATIQNGSGRSFERAKVVLVSGLVHRAREAPPGPLFREAATTLAAVSEYPQEEPLFEYYEYELGRLLSLEDGQAKHVPLLADGTVRCNKRYVYEGLRDRNRVRTEIVFVNEKPSGLGRALPAGTVRIFQKTRQGMRLLGEDRIPTVPVGKEVSITTGYAFDLEGKRTLVETRQISPEAREETYAIDIKNSKHELVRVEVLEHLPGDWEIRRSSHPFRKKSATDVQFVVDVPADGQATIQYTAVIHY